MYHKTSRFFETCLLAAAPQPAGSAVSFPAARRKEPREAERLCPSQLSEEVQVSLYLRMIRYKSTSRSVVRCADFFASEAVNCSFGIISFHVRHETAVTASRTLVFVSGPHYLDAGERSILAKVMTQGLFVHLQYTYILLSARKPTFGRIGPQSKP